MPNQRTPVQTESKPPATTTATSPAAQGSAEASKTVSSKETPGVGTTQRRVAPTLTPPKSTAPGQEKTSAPPLPPPTTSPLPPSTASPLPSPPAVKKLEPIYPTKIPLQGAPGK